MNSDGSYSFANPSQLNNNQTNGYGNHSRDGENDYNNDNYYDDGEDGSVVYSVSDPTNPNDVPNSSVMPPSNGVKPPGVGGMPHMTDHDEADHLYANPLKDEETEDGRVRNQEAAMKIKDAWIYKQIQARQVGI